MHKKSIAKTSYRNLLKLSTRVIGVKNTKELDAKVRFKRNLNLDNPVTLADKVSWLELNTDQTIPSQLTDKYAVRDFVRERGLEDILVPLCGGPWESADEVDFDALPESFVLKATHGCEMNLIVTDKSQLDIDEARKTMAQWLKEDYPRACIEPHYQNIQPRLYAEELLHDEQGIKDYKIHCINGEPAFILCCSDREYGLRLSLFDLDWNPLTEHLQRMPIASPLPSRPPLLKEMIEISKTLSAGFPFVRVDLYNVGSSIYFGEMTFSPAAGVFEYYDDEFNVEWGKRLDISKC